MDEFLRCRLAEDHPGPCPQRLYERPSITISRQAGARGLEVAAKLVDYLTQFDETAEHGWAMFDQSLLAKVIENRQLPPCTREYLTPVVSPQPAHEIVQEFQRLPTDQWTLFHHSANAIRCLCRLGNVIILGRGGNFLTQDLPNVLHVRLVGDPDQRSRVVAAESDLAEDKAGEYRESLDVARAKYVKRHLNREIDDSAAYHLTINVSRLNPSTTSRIIGDSVIEWAGERILPMSA
ncbi:MAG: cytidylate kinase-like family protein [Verrucomicrobiae bacterium]|nr:cytidylate kinase-like family protein [Verrucomicrobiae bacterium]